MKGMSDAARHNETGEGLIVAPLDEAIRLAKPWNWDEPSGLEDIPTPSGTRSSRHLNHGDIASVSRRRHRHNGSVGIGQRPN
jgi:hypothetical protein